MIRIETALTCVALASVLTGATCVPNQGRFEQNRFQHETYPYAVWYGTGATPAEVLGSDWRVDNFYATDGSTTPNAAKTGPEHEVRRSYDTNGDGSYESQRDEPFYDLLLKHRKRDAALWIRSVPIEFSDASKDLSVFAARYLDAVAGSGSVVVRFGADGPAGLIERRFAARKLAAKECSVTDKPAYRMDFEVANVDQVQLTPDARWSRGSLVIAGPGYTNTVTAANGTQVHYPVLILIGLSASPEDYPALEPELDRLLSQLVLSDRMQGLPLKGKHTCQVGAEGAGGEVKAPANTAAPAPALDAATQDTVTP